MLKFVLGLVAAAVLLRGVETIARAASCSDRLATSTICASDGGVSAGSLYWVWFVALVLVLGVLLVLPRKQS